MVPEENKFIMFKRAVVRDLTSAKGNPYTALDIEFDEDFRERIFEPASKARSRWMVPWRKMANLADVLGLDVTEMPKTFGWLDLIETWADLVNKRENTPLFAKITKNEDGYICLGEAPCFSNNPDLSYTDADLAYYVPVGDDDIEIQDLPT